MKTLGIVGGIAPESTIDYYRRIIALYRERTRDGSYPPIVITSIDMKRMLDLIDAGKLPEVTEYLLIEILRLAKAGADVGMLASSTPHLVFDDLRRRSPIPLVSIVEAACDAARSLGIGRVGLFGTRFTMQARFYPEVLPSTESRSSCQTQSSRMISMTDTCRSWCKASIGPKRGADYWKS